MASSSSSKPIFIDLVDSEDDDSPSSSSSDDDSEFEDSSEETTPNLRQTTLDGYKKRGAEEDLLKNTFLEDFALRAANWETFRIQNDRKTSYNYMDLQIDGVLLQVWQGSVEDIGDEELKFARILDLQGGKSQKTSKELSNDFATLLRLGWNNSGTIKESLDTTQANSASKRLALRNFLEDTLVCLSAIARQCTTAPKKATSGSRPEVLIIACARGLERSLLLFNLLAYAVALRGEELHGDHNSLKQVCEVTANRFRLSHGRLDADGEPIIIKNESIHSTIDNLPKHMAFFLIAAQGSKKQRYEMHQKSRGYLLYF